MSWWNRDRRPRRRQQKNRPEGNAGPEKPLRVLFSGGGTGGHVYPALALADLIRLRRPDAEILFIGTRKGLESREVPRKGYEIRHIEVSGFYRKNLLRNGKVMVQLLRASADARRILKEWRPDAVIGTGGYVCGPVVRAGSILGIPSFIHEQNAVPGLTNRLLERYADRVFLGFAEAETGFRNRGKLLLTGNPVRREFFEMPRETGRELLEIPREAFAVLLVGGSGGAATFLEEGIKLIRAFNGDKNTVLLFAAGRNYYPRLLERLRDEGIQPEENIRITEYITDMPAALAACDLAVSRAGAIAVAEIRACGRASVLIPSPNVAGNHQLFNARATAESGGALLLEEKDLGGDALLKIIDTLRNDRDRLAAMEEAALTRQSEDAAEIIYRKLFQ